MAKQYVYMQHTDYPNYLTLGAEDPHMLGAIWELVYNALEDMGSKYTGDYVFAIKGGIIAGDDDTIVEARGGFKSPTEGLTFGQALECMKHGKFVRLPSWSPEVRIGAQYPDNNSKMTHPYLYVVSRKGCVPWKETYPELFSEEWEIYKGE